MAETSEKKQAADNPTGTQQLTPADNFPGTQYPTSEAASRTVPAEHYCNSARPIRSKFSLSRSSYIDFWNFLAIVIAMDSDSTAALDYALDNSCEHDFLHLVHVIDRLRTAKFEQYMNTKVHNVRFYV
jgi:hypothetical protein